MNPESDKGDSVCVRRCPICTIYCGRLCGYFWNFPWSVQKNIYGPGQFLLIFIWKFLSVCLYINLQPLPNRLFFFKKKILTKVTSLNKFAFKGTYFQTSIVTVWSCDASEYSELGQSLHLWPSPHPRCHPNLGTWQLSCVSQWLQLLLSHVVALCNLWHN